MRRRFLVTGGAGFVGSHLVAALLDRGDQCIVVDNLRTGHRAAVLPGARLVDIDLADKFALHAVLNDGPWDGVFHFAALSLVGESMRDPMRYFIENVGYGTCLIDACVRHGIGRFVMSSTAALFGRPSGPLIDEMEVQDPVSAYGASKLMLEQALYWASRAHGLRYACLRYFNAAGSDPEGRLGEHHDPETHLIPLVIDAALGRSSGITVFGQDYNTPDGTGIRDYVHVSDLADAHLRAFDRLDAGNMAYNLGTGIGHSVMDVIRSVERLSGCRVPFEIVGRRAGDPPVLVANPALVRAETGWRPYYPALDDIVGTALAWREANPNGFHSAPLGNMPSYATEFAVRSP